MIAIPDDKWGERPLLIVKPKEGQASCAGLCRASFAGHRPAVTGLQQAPHCTAVSAGGCTTAPANRPPQSPTKGGVLEWLAGKIAKWWMPDDVVFVKGGWPEWMRRLPGARWTHQLQPAPGMLAAGGPLIPSPSSPVPALQRSRTPPPARSASSRCDSSTAATSPPALSCRQGSTMCSLFPVDNARARAAVATNHERVQLHMRRGPAGMACRGATERGQYIGEALRGA